MHDDCGGLEAVEKKRVKRTFIDQLYRDHWASLVGWLRRRYGLGPPDPEDVAQAAFAKIAALDDVNHIRDPKNFLYTTAINTALSSISWLANTRAFIEREMSAFNETLDEVEPERVYAAKDELGRIMQLLEALPAKQREILIRSRFLGQKHREITEHTGWSNADISRNLTAVLAMIERALRGNEEA